MKNFRPITQWNEDDRPREKLVTKGRHALSDAELLAILIGTGARFREGQGNLITKSAVDLGKDILQLVDNNLINLARLNSQELQKIRGVGEAKAVSIIAALELGARRKNVKDEKQKIMGSRDAYEILAGYVQDLNVEQFWAILLNRANMVLKVHQFTIGGITGTVMDPGPLFKEALLMNARGIVLCHNHPSGNLTPSEADIQITRKIRNGGNLLDIVVQDHIIVGQQGYFSFSDQGMMGN